LCPVTPAGIPLIQSNTDDRDDWSMKYLLIVQANIQHNENMRNRLFQFYLGIVGGFFVLFQATESLNLSKQTIFFCSVFMSILGFFFLWAFERIREMIQRDTEIVNVINRSLFDGTNLERRILRVYNNYSKTIATTSLKWWSLTSCFAFSTALISGVVLAVGLKSRYEMEWYAVGGLAIVIAILYCLAIKALNILARASKKT